MLCGPGTTTLNGRQSLSRTGASGVEPAARARHQHLAVAHQQPRPQPDLSLEGRDDREIELVGQHHLGEHGAVALDDVQPHVGVLRHEVVERRRQHGAGEGRHQPDAQVAGDGAGEGAHLLVGGVELAQRRRRSAGSSAAPPASAPPRAPSARTASRRACARPRRRAARCPDWVAFSRAAARVNEPSSHTAITARTCRSAIPAIDAPIKNPDSQAAEYIISTVGRHPASICCDDSGAGDRAAYRGDSDGSEFRHRRPGLAAAGQLGPPAQVPHSSARAR